MKKRILLLCLSLSSFASSQDATRLLHNTLQNTQSMTASFTQVVKAKKQVLSHSSGTMALLRPGRFRWQIKTPMEQLVVADGKKMWVYDKELEQVTVKKQERSLEGAAALFLSAYNDELLHEFYVSETTKNETRVFNLRKKSNKAHFESIQLVFAKNKLTGLRLRDSLGQTTTVSFQNTLFNLKLPPTLFQFTPPKGVDVVYQ